MHDIKESAVEETIGRQVERYLVRLEAGQILKPGCCQVCEHSDCLRWHGGYMRSLITMSRAYALPVKRLLCSACGHTFALLPVFVIKFRSYAREAILHALRKLDCGTYESVAGLFQARADCGIAILTLHFWRRRFGVIKP